MNTIPVPTRENVSESNQIVFDSLKKSVGFVPNMYAMFAHSETALQDYLSLQNRATSLNAKEKEVINLLVSQLNHCDYCKAAHTAVGQMVGFTEEETLAIRKATIDFDPKLQALAQLTKAIVDHKGEVPDTIQTNFFDAGYTIENLIDLAMIIGDKIITNYLFALTKVPIDFPEVKSL